MAYSDANQVHYEQYVKYFDNEKTFLKITKEMLTTRGVTNKSFTKIFKLLRLQWLNYSKTPTFDDIFLDGELYTKESKAVLKSTFRSMGFVGKDSHFKEQVFFEYIELHNKHNNTKRKFICIKHDVVINPDVMIDLSFTYDNTMETIRKNPADITYHFPEHLQNSARRLEYPNVDTIQIIKLNHVGGNPRTPIPLTYHYSCACGNETELPYEIKDLICDNEECGRKMTRSRTKDVFFAGYASQVIADDFNNIPVLSLVPIPLGEFNAAVFLRRNKTGYYLFLIAIEDIVIESSDIKINENEHTIWQLIRLIDTIHEERLGKHIDGMDWYKASILLSYLANLQRYTSMNVLSVGKGGTGKTSVPRFYLATLTQQFKLQDAIALSSPGMYGSTSMIKIGESVVTIPEAGLLSRYQMVIVDEVYLKGIKILPVLRSTLRASTINKEVAGNRTSMVKNACVVGTSNPITEVLITQSHWMEKWIKTNEDGVHTSLTEEFAHAAMIEEWVKRDLDWHTGQPFPDMDRWMLIFFIQKKDKRLKKYHLNPNDMKISDIELSKMFFDQSIHDYFTLCSGIKVNYEKQSDRILNFVDELRKHDTIHTDRIAQDITLILTLSAQVNGRAELTDEDFDFVRELWGKTCHWVDVDDLRYDPQVKTYPAQEWTIKTIKKRVHEYMTDIIGTKHKDDGFAMIADKLEGEGAPAGLVENTIKHYRQNPQQ